MNLLYFLPLFIALMQFLGVVGAVGAIVLSPLYLPYKMLGLIF